MRIDLHVHSKFSDGSLTPAQLVCLAKEQGLYAFALTDHDTVAGVPEAWEAAKGGSPIVIPGIELSSDYNGQDIHILGYQVDLTAPRFLEKLKTYQQNRDIRNRKMLRLMADYGLPVAEEDFFACYPGAVITRAHFAEYLLRVGAVSSMQEAFERYIGNGCPCYLPKETISCQEAISCILAGKGHPVLAHPFQYRFSEAKLEALIRELTASGLEGLEVIYPYYTQAKEIRLRELAKKYGLHITGGSDFHGDKKPDIQLGTGTGSLYVHHEVMDWLF